MTRQDCTDHLMGLGEGAFVVRDSAATPGWHMLGVKSHNKVLHEKIRMTEDGMYELLPTTTAGAKQPKFRDMPALIQYYVSSRVDMPYTLALSNPIYDNHQLVQTRAGYAQAADVTHDPSAPSVPLRDREVGAVAQLGDASAAGEDLYTNTVEAKSALRARDRSVRVRGLPGSVDDDEDMLHEVPGYLAVGDHLPEE